MEQSKIIDTLETYQCSCHNDENPTISRHDSILTGRVNEDMPRNVKQGPNKMVQCVSGLDATLHPKVVSRDTLFIFFKSLAFEAKGCTNLVEPNTIHQFAEDIFEGGTRLAMPKTIRKPNSSSSKTSSRATEGVLDRGGP